MNTLELLKMMGVLGELGYTFQFYTDYSGHCFNKKGERFFSWDSVIELRDYLEENV